MEVTSTLNEKNPYFSSNSCVLCLMRDSMLSTEKHSCFFLNFHSLFQLKAFCVFRKQHDSYISFRFIQAPFNNDFMIKFYTLCGHNIGCFLNNFNCNCHFFLHFKHYKIYPH